MVTFYVLAQQLPPVCNDLLLAPDLFRLYSVQIMKHRSSLSERFAGKYHLVIYVKSLSNSQVTYQQFMYAQYFTILGRFSYADLSDH